MEATGMSEPGLGVGSMPSPELQPLSNEEDDLLKGAKVNRKTTKELPVTVTQCTDKDDDEDKKPASWGVGPRTSELKGGCKEEAIDVDEIAVKAEEMFILKPERLTDVYKFSGSLEFVALPKEARVQKKSTIQSWRDTEKNGYAAIHLFTLSKWFKDLRFSAMVHPPPLDENDGKDFWHFGLIVINPRAAYINLASHSHYRSKINCFHSILRDFNFKGFHADDAITESINQAIRTETIIMILAKRALGGKASKKKADITVNEFFLATGLKAIAAITFR